MLKALLPTDGTKSILRAVRPIGSMRRCGPSQAVGALPNRAGAVARLLLGSTGPQPIHPVRLGIPITPARAGFGRAA